MVIDDDCDVYYGPHIAEGRRSVQATAGFEPELLNAGERLKEAVAVPKEQSIDIAPDTRDLSLVGEGSQSYELREFMQSVCKK